MNKKETNLTKNSLISGLWYGFTQCILYVTFAVLYYVGARLLVDGITTGDSMNKAIFAVIMAAFGVGNAQTYVKDMDKAKEALISIYKVLNIHSEIDPEETSGKTAATNNFKGKIEFRNVSFSYPTRNKIKVLKDISFTIQPGQSIAFVGPSGSGKSSIVQLIERFYDASSGEILIDDVNVKDYQLIELRKKIAIVLQEPVLFKTSILENIRYGKLDSNDEEVKEAATKAYIDKFFESNINPNDINFDKSLVSGGEKQRLAIARSIIKNPSILLLDEATSALDKNSEEIVQKALTEQLKGKTSIIIAHRLSTITSCDLIFVMENGRIKEKGNHNDLIKLKGRYYNLINSGSHNN